MNAKHMLISSMLTLATLSLSATECVWNGPSGDWGSEAGWKDGVRPAASGDTVVVKGAGVAVTVRDADIANFQLVTKITVESADSRIVVDTTGDVATPAEFLGKGKLVKSGSSKLDLLYAGTASNPYAAVGAFGELVISNGTVQLPNRTAAMGLSGWIYICRFSVWKPGILSLGNSPYTACNYGLRGDGAIKNDNSGCQLYTSCYDHDNPPVFNGEIQPNVQLTVIQDATRGGAVQYLAGEGSDCDLTLRMDGWFGTSKIGMIGARSPIGTSKAVPFRTKNSRLVCLGTEAETTDKVMQFASSSACGTIDAGAYGGITFSGEWQISGHTNWKPDYRCNTICLTGTNEAPCVIAGGMYDMNDRAATYWRKEGTGTWKFQGNKSTIGTFDVRRGTLQFDSLAERGTWSALGTAGLTFEDGSDLASSERTLENMIANHAVPYAIRLGETNVASTADHIATLEYVGSSAVTCTTRPIALAGAGCVRTTGGALHLAGATALGTGTGTLVLDGAGNDTFESVTNGLGTVNVLKRGTGTWNLPADIDVGAVMAEQGTLKVGSAYTYYRWTVTSDNYGLGGKWQPQFNGFALLDKDGNMVNGSLGANGMADAKRSAPYTLDPGEICEKDAWGSYGGRTPATAFHWLGTGFEGSAANWQVTPYNDKPSTHPGVYFRPDDGVSVAKYDVLSFGNDGGSAQSVAHWRLEGSEDGVSWTVLHTVNATNMPALPTGKNSGIWCSDASTGKAPTKGYDIAIGNTNGTICIASVGAATGATVSFVGTAAGISVSNLVLNANGGGAIKGAAFAESGTLDLTNWSSGKFNAPIALDLSASTGAKNIENWTVKADGRSLTRRISVTENGITVFSNGLIMLVR